MQASEARELSKKARADSIKALAIVSRIDTAARKGDNSVSINLDSEMIKCYKELETNLQNLGYNVKRNCGGDCRESWDYIVISW